MSSLLLHGYMLISTVMVTLPTIINLSSAHRVFIHHQDHPDLKKFRFDQLNDADDYDYEKPLVHVVDKTYLIGLELGDPSTKVYLVFDTGSGFIWVQHASCLKCVEAQPPVVGQYNGSNTLKYEHCEVMSDCTHWQYIPGSGCKENVCTYTVTYGDDTESSGKVATEKFVTSEKRYSGLLFGVGLDSICQPRKTSCFQGIAGFGAGPLALPIQLRATTWGFCLPHNSSVDGSFFTNDDATFPGEFKTTRLYEGEYGTSYYLANLTSIFVEGSWSKISPPHGRTSMIMIDTGSTLTSLQDEIFDGLVSSIKTLLAVEYNVSPVQPTDDTLLLGYELCYAMTHQVETAIQVGDVYVTIEPESLWVKHDESFCLSFMRIREGSEHEHNLNILGSQHIRGYMVVYEVLDKDNMFLKVSTSPLDDEEAKACLSPVLAP